MSKKNTEKEVPKNTKYSLSEVHHSNTVRYLKLRANDKISSIDIDAKLQTGGSFPIKIVADKEFDAKYKRIIHIDDPHNSVRILNSIVSYFANNEYLDYSLYSQFSSKCQYFRVIGKFNDIDALVNVINSTSNLIITVHYDNPEEERIERNKLKGEIAKKKLYKLFGYDPERYNITHIKLESNYNNLPFNMFANEGSLRYIKRINPHLCDIYEDDGPEEYYEKLFTNCCDIYADNNKGRISIGDMLDLVTDYLKYSDNTIEDNVDIIISPFRKASFLRVTIEIEDLNVLDDK